MPIQHIIIHEVTKEPPSTAAANLREQENPVNDHAERVGSQLLSLFKGLNIGGFHRPDNPGLPLSAFETLLSAYFVGDDFSDFVAFSRGASEILVEKLNDPKAQQAKGGYLLLNHYTHQGNHFLSVVLLRMRQGISLSKDLSFTAVDELNLDTLHMAAWTMVCPFCWKKYRACWTHAIHRRTRRKKGFFSLSLKMTMR